MGTLNLRAYRPKLGTLSLQSRISGIQYDDDANQFLLHGYFRLDAYGSHDFGPASNSSPPERTSSTAPSKSPRRPPPRWLHPAWRASGFQINLRGGR